jgi:hypothetical protein
MVEEALLDLLDILVQLEVFKVEQVELGMVVIVVDKHNLEEVVQIKAQTIQVQVVEVLDNQ